MSSTTPSKRQLAALDTLNERVANLTSRIEAQDATLLQVVDGLQRVARRVTRLEKVLTQHG